MPLRRLLLIASAMLFAPVALLADDWPQWMGPKRDNVWRETGIIDKFADGRSRRSPGACRSAAATPGRRSRTGRSTSPIACSRKVRPTRTTRSTQRTRSTAPSASCASTPETGKEIWKHEYECPYQISYPAGPRCTPTRSRGEGLHPRRDGQSRSASKPIRASSSGSKDLKTEYKTKPAIWGYAAHPLIDGKKLITLAGGDGSHVVALDKDTGKEIWKAGQQPEQGYSPVLITEAGGKRQMIVCGIEVDLLGQPRDRREVLGDALRGR